jgi:hypothetical protein
MQSPQPKDMIHSQFAKLMATWSSSFYDDFWFDKTGDLRLAPVRPFPISSTQFIAMVLITDVISDGNKGNNSQAFCQALFL